MAAHERGMNMTAKRINLQLNSLNGNSYKKKRFVVNRAIPNFESLLIAAAEKFGSPAREIRTPNKGRRCIKNLDELETDGTYVVMGRERVVHPFKELKPQRLPPIKQEENWYAKNRRKFGNVPGRARDIGKRKKEEMKTINVFCNGMFDKSRRVQLKTDYKMDQVLEWVNEKVSSHSKNGAVYYLYTVDESKRIFEPSQLQDNGRYVAVGRERIVDKSVPYNDHGAASQLTPRRASTKPRVPERKPPSKHKGAAKRSSKKKSFVASNDDPISSLAGDFAASHFNGINSSPEPVREEEPSLFDSFKEAVTESIRDDEPQRAYAAAERSDSPHESEIEDIPIEETIQSKAADVLGDNGVPLQDLVDNAHSVYEASGHDKEDAKEVQDDKETIEDKPIDEMPAEEVADEEIEDEDSKNRVNAEDDLNSDNEGQIEHEEEVDEEIEESKEDNEKEQQPEASEPPEANELSEANEPSEEIKPADENEPSDSNEPSEEIKPSDDNEPSEQIKPSDESEPQESRN